MIGVAPARYLASNNNLPMLYLSVLLLLTVLGITPAASGPHLVSAATATVVQPGAVTIGVDVQGSWFVNDRPSPDSEFPGLLQEALETNRVRPVVVHVYADRSAPFTRVERALLLAGSVGVRRAELVAHCPGSRETYMERCAPEQVAAPDAPRR